MYDFEIKYSKRYLNESIGIGFAMMTVSLLAIIFLVRSVIIILLLILFLMGLKVVINSLKLLLNNRVAARITTTAIEFRGGRILPLDDIKSIYENKKSKYDKLFIVTKINYEIELSNNSMYELPIDDIKKNLIYIMKNRVAEQGTYDIDFDIKYTTFSIVITGIIATIGIVFFNYFIFFDKIGKISFIIINLAMGILLLTFVAYRFLIRDKLYATLTNNDIIFRNGDEISFKDIKNYYVKTIYYGSVKGEEYLSEDKQRSGKEKSRILYVVTKNGSRHTICTSGTYNFSPEYVQSVLKYKLAKHYKVS